ncbi:MAG: hypothetical protein KF802_13120 [Bdellovibrionaceae bacterium]|nr:hypothetical protein [Pseudobdellovibrionaceae bacterium]
MQADEGFPQELRQLGGAEMPIEEVLDAETLRAAGFNATPAPGQVLAIRSSDERAGIIGFVEVKSSRIRPDGKVEATVRVLRLSRHYLVRPRDHLMQLDLRTSQPLYSGHTELLVRDRWENISTRYRALFTQGFSIGETAQTLGRNEVFLSIYGYLSYGLQDGLTVGSLVPGLLLDSPNGNIKWRVYEGVADTVSVSTSLTKIRNSSSTAVNLTVYWDSITSDKMVSHTLATFAVATLENVEDTVAIKTAGTSSLQTGYELLMSNWDRVLFGPSYNFETKTLGGYIAYMRIWDRFHLSGSLSTVDVRELKLDPKTGYVALIEAYWRF